VRQVQLHEEMWQLELLRPFQIGHRLEKILQNTASITSSSRQYFHLNSLLLVVKADPSSSKTSDTMKQGVEIVLH